jgi:hypothetical protein
MDEIERSLHSYLDTSSYEQVLCYWAFDGLIEFTREEFIATRILMNTRLGKLICEAR